MRLFFNFSVRNKLITIPLKQLPLLNILMIAFIIYKMLYASHSPELFMALQQTYGPLIGKHHKMHKPKRSEEHTSELQSRGHLVSRLLLEKKNKPERGYS